MGAYTRCILDKRRLAVRWIIICLLCASLSVTLALAAQVTILTQDDLSNPLPARLHVEDSLGQIFPGYPDSTYLSHDRLGGYFYTSGSITCELPTGETEVAAMHGFECEPYEAVWDVQSDTTVVITLPRRFDLEQDGWFGGDTHIHTIHVPVDLEVSPYGLWRIAQAEDLSMVWALDNGHEFTGGVHEISTPETIIYYSVEFRNQAYGHAVLLGLDDFIDGWCCGPPGNPAYPMLTFTYQEWNPGHGEAMTLAHPHTGAEFFDDEEWPGVGQGRELPVMAALGSLDGLELASYSNNPDLFLDDWYRLLNCGLRVSPASGTDAITCSYHAPPVGGYRVYVREGVEQPHAYDQWVEALKAGNCFVTNYPLIPRFHVEGLEPGEELVLPSVPAEVDVSFRVESVHGLDTAQIIFSGDPLLTIPDPCQNAAGVLDTTVTVTIEGSGWLALSVEGATSAWGPAQPDLFAHTGAIYVDGAGETVSSTVDAAHFLGWIDSLEVFVELRGNWSGSQRGEVLGTLQDARDVYSSAFLVPPNPFELISPAEDEVVLLNETVAFDWELNGDSEEGDRLSYLLQVATTPGFYPLTLSQWFDTAPDSIDANLLDPDTEYWWRVRAYDLGGHYTDCTPAAIRFTTLDWQSDIPDAAADLRQRWPVDWRVPRKPGADRCRLAADRLRPIFRSASGSVGSASIDRALLDSAGRVLSHGAGRSAGLAAQRADPDRSLVEIADRFQLLLGRLVDDDLRARVGVFGRHVVDQLEAGEHPSGPGHACGDQVVPLVPIARQIERQHSFVAT